MGTPQTIKAENKSDSPLSTLDVQQEIRASKPPAIATDLTELQRLQLRYSTVYADPPWEYDNTSARGAAANHYPTMSIKRICEEPVSDLAADCAHLHLWTTNAFLREAFDVMTAWGFTYKSCLIWVKPQMGMGNYWRVSHEFLLLGVRAYSSSNPVVNSQCLQTDMNHSRKSLRMRTVIPSVFAWIICTPGPTIQSANMHSSS